MDCIKKFIGFLFVAMPFILVAQDTAGRYTKVENGYVMVLQQNDSLFKHLEDIAVKEKISGANFTGMGFVNITFGYFDQTKQTYLPASFNKVELASMHGSIAWKDGKSSIHAHGVVTGKDFKAYGGHILSAAVSTGSLEIMIVTHNKNFTRKRDEGLGADVMQVD